MNSDASTGTEINPSFPKKYYNTTIFNVAPSTSNLNIIIQKLQKENLNVPHKTKNRVGGFPLVGCWRTNSAGTLLQK